jgi:hypothetical protein
MNWDFGTDKLGAQGDEFYAALIHAHEGLNFEDSAALNARLVLILGNQIGNIDILKSALKEAQKK